MNIRAIEQEWNELIAESDALVMAANHLIVLQILSLLGFFVTMILVPMFSTLPVVQLMQIGLFLFFGFGVGYGLPRFPKIQSRLNEIQMRLTAILAAQKAANESR
jgi:hypothetical protein